MHSTELAGAAASASFPMQPGFYNMDCMEAMKKFPDKFFDLAIVDPPYGGGYKEDDDKLKNLRGGAAQEWQQRRHGRWGQRFDRYYISHKEVQHITEVPVEEVRPARGRLRCR